VFDAQTRAWFEATYGEPTDIQAKAWPRIAAGGHVLLTAPTGSGKTLTAFLSAIDRLATGEWEPGTVRVLYVSPLKALNRDIAINLLDPLASLGVDLRVGLRSGDTDPAERRRQLKSPPEILVTTPESLNLLLSSHGGRRILHGVHCVILDEIHAVAHSKRGTYLMTAVERLTELSGEFQRIALSATVKPLDRMARFVGGDRAVETIASDDTKTIELSVHAVPEEDGPPWPRLARQFREIAERNTSTLFFVNNRALSERIVRQMNELGDEPIAYAHHGSLAQATRRLVEERLKKGELKAIVATSSLELGIDIGALDEVVLVQSPRTLHSAVQRIGRAGHQVGAASVGRLYPTFGRDFLDAAVLGPLIRERVVETLRVPRAPLDVLAQVLVAMVGVEERDPDSIYRLLRRCDPYRDLSRASFDRVVAMVTGRYADTRIRELKPRVHQDPETAKLRGASGALPLVWRSGGVIPDRGYYTLRIEGTSARLGELDEEFVWERKRGDVFALGSRNWRVEAIRRNEVEVSPVDGGGSMPPFWRAEAMVRDFDLCERIGEFLKDPEIPDWPDEPANRLDEFLKRQRAVTGCDLPHRHHIVIEHPSTTAAGGEGRQVIIHAPWGGRVLRPLEIAISAAWEGVETFSNDDCILITLPIDMSAKAIFDRVTPENIESLLRARLERTGFFARQFRENAQRALLLPRRGWNERTPLWLNRMRAGQLFEAVRKYDDFPILAETWRTCIEDEFDLPHLRQLLDEVATGVIRITEVATPAPSPFADGVGWRSVNQYMYADDQPIHQSSNLSDEVLRDALQDAALRPKLDPKLAAELDAKLCRTAPGYAPESDGEWLDHVEERILVPAWTDELPPGLEALGPWVVSRRQRKRIAKARAGDPEALASCIGEQLRYRGPVTAAELAEAWGTDVEPALADLVEQGAIIADRLTEGARETEYCDAQNLERLLRMQRRARRKPVAARPLSELPGFLAARQGVGSCPDLPAALEPLLGFVAPAALWEEAILPARLASFDLDALMVESGLLWFGAGSERAGFAFPQDLPLFLEPREEVPEPFPSATGRYEFFDLPGSENTAALSERIWTLAFDGAITNDTFSALRQGIANRFKPVTVQPRRRGFRTWQSSRPLVGAWRVLQVAPALDELDELERDKERVRILLQRYGLLNRALLKHELNLLGWGRLQRALRLMELSGEVIGGHFFEGLEGLQFIAPDAIDLEPARSFWIHAMDPASVGPRSRSGWSVYDEGELALTVRRNGRELEWHVEPKPEHLVLFRGRDVLVEEVAGAPAAWLKECGFYEDRGRWVHESGLR
jgi:ATP-dependent Lhr-like helicase